MANFGTIELSNLCVKNFYFKILITFYEGKILPSGSELRKEKEHPKCVASSSFLLLFVLALVSQAAHAAIAGTAAPRWDRSNAAPRWDRVVAAPRWDSADAPRWD